MRLLSAFFFFVVTFLYWSGSGVAGEVKRIAYLEPGPYWVFKNNMTAFKAALAKREEFEVVFPPELTISLDWKDGADAMDDAIDFLMNRDDVDLIIAAGVSASRALINRGDGKKPIIGMGMADPLLAGVVRSLDDSGVDNFTCEVMNDRWKQMLRMFHDVVNFTKLGILYSAMPEGKLYSGLDDARAVAEERDFEVIAREIADEETASCADGLRWLHDNGADAFFIGPLSCFNWDLSDPFSLLRQLNIEYQMPTFARDGTIFVKGGALMGLATWDLALSGERQADKAYAIFNGAKPRSLVMRTGIDPLIAINLQTAREIGFDIPFDVILAADEIYSTTTRPEVKQSP